MIIHTWPATLPQMPSKTYAYGMRNGLAAVADYLSPWRTRTYPDYAATFTLLNLTVAQLTTLREFFDTTLNHCGFFYAPWIEACSFEPEDYCQIDGPPEVVFNGKGFDVTLKVNIIKAVPHDGIGNVTYGKGV